MRVVRKRKAKGKELLEILRRMQKLFSSRVFRNFVDVKRDFRYYDCLRGTDYYSLPFPTWPKFMTVISRTNLDLRKPAAVGILEYKRKDFRKAVEKIFGY